MLIRKHHSVIVVGGGPGGLGVSALLNGWSPYLIDGSITQLFGPKIASQLTGASDDLFSLDMNVLVEAGITPLDLFRTLHHPSNDYRGRASRALGFRKKPSMDWLMLSMDPAGGLWNHVARNQLTLSPAHWMELAPYRIDDFFDEIRCKHDPNHLIRKSDLLAYYRHYALKTGIIDRMLINTQVTRISCNSGPERFNVETMSTLDGTVTEYTADFIVFAVGPRAILRKLDVPGENLDYVSRRYDHWSKYPGANVAVVGGGRSADWAATELHDAGRNVTYVMRGKPSTHMRLIDDSQHLPYYSRIRKIIGSSSPRFHTLYETEVRMFEPGGKVVLDSANVLQVDHVVVEIGGEPAYQLLRDFGELTLAPARDRYRFQVMQMAVDTKTYESVDIPGLYPAGYLAAGTGISVLGMHGTAYPTAADIIGKLTGNKAD